MSCHIVLRFLYFGCKESHEIKCKNKCILFKYMIKKILYCYIEIK